MNVPRQGFQTHYNSSTRTTARSGAAACMHAPQEKLQAKNKNSLPRLAFRSAGPAAVRLGPTTRFAEPRQSVENRTRPQSETGGDGAAQGVARRGGVGEAVRRREPFTAERAVARGKGGL